MTTVLITGANRGLGLEFARQYAADGADVIACCRHPDRADSLKRLGVKVLELVKENKDLQENLSVAAHLIHGSSDGRFHITYCTEKLSEQEVRGASFNYMPYCKAIELYNPKILKDGFNTLPDGEEIFYISNPALGLWTCATVED